MDNPTHHEHERTSNMDANEVAGPVVLEATAKDMLAAVETLIRCKEGEAMKDRQTRPGVADEREACAEIALAYGRKAAHLYYKQAAKDIAAAIRNRGKGHDV